MAGNELVTEGFRPGQVGSSAMPHKMNTRSAERINGFAVILRGYASMAGELAGDQWNEGDVSCSVVRRVALPDAFFALDGLLRDDADRARRVRRVPGGDRAGAGPLPALPRHDEGADGRGARRRRPEAAHEAIKENAVAVALEMREKGAERNDLFDRLAADSPARAVRGAAAGVLAEPLTFTGAAHEQVAAVVAAVEPGARPRSPPPRATGPSRSSDVRAQPGVRPASRSGRPRFQ